MITDRWSAERWTAPQTFNTPGRLTPDDDRDERTRRRLSLAFCLGMALFIAVGLTTGFGQRAGQGEALPPPPAATP